jgi:hypothetical protein
MEVWNPKMNNKQEVKELCLNAIERINQAVQNHEQGIAEDLNIPILQKVAGEIQKMASELDKSKYKPSYPRFLLDWPDEHGLVEYLIQVSYEYSKRT